MVAFGIRRNKVILSARSNNANIHVGKLLSSHFQTVLLVAISHLVVAKFHSRSLINKIVKMRSRMKR